MNEKKSVFSNIEKNTKNNKIKSIIINKINIPKEVNSLDISNKEIDSSLKKFKEKKGIKKEISNKILNIKEIEELKLNNSNSYFSKNKNIENKFLSTCNINSMNKKIKDLSIIKTNSNNNIINNNIINNNKSINNNNETKTEKESKNLSIILSTEQNKKIINVNSLLLKTNEEKYISNKKIENDINYNYNYKKRDSRNSKNISKDYYNAFQCLFCEDIYKGNEISQLILCEHKFCRKCGKNFYYDLIANGYDNRKFKCPFLYCKKEIPQPIIESLLSSKKINQINQDIQDNEFTNRNFINKEKENNKEHEIDCKNLGNYTIKKKNENINDNKYVININNLKNDYIFYLQSKRIFILCPKCGKNALYRKASNYYLKCLYCTNKFCKFCIKLLNENHFAKDNLKRCKVYFRAKEKKKKKFYVLFAKQIFLMIAGYLFLMSYFINKMKGIYKNKYIFIEKIIRYFFFFMLFIIFFPIIILLIPYYPIISCF